MLHRRRGSDSDRKLTSKCEYNPEKASSFSEPSLCDSHAKDFCNIIRTFVRKCFLEQHVSVDALEETGSVSLYGTGIGVWGKVHTCHKELNALYRQYLLGNAPSVLL